MQQQAGTAARDELVTRALRLVTASVIFGVLSGAVSVITGLRAGSLGVFAVGLGVFADVIGSAVLIWRFRAERRHPASPHAREESAAVIVGIALAMVAVVLAAESVTALASGTHPGSSATALISAAVSLAVLAPLAAAKRRAGGKMGSRALMGDGALSGIGAATSLLALAALALYHTLGWWWADRVAALAVAVIAAAEAWHTIPRPGSTPHPSRAACHQSQSRPGGLKWPARAADAGTSAPEPRRLSHGRHRPRVHQTNGLDHPHGHWNAPGVPYTDAVTLTATCRILPGFVHGTGLPLLGQLEITGTNHSPLTVSDQPPRSRAGVPPGRAASLPGRCG